MRIWPLSVVETAEKDSEFLTSVQIRELRKKKRQDYRDAKLSSLAGVLQTNNPADDYPNTRAIRRHFLLMVGETNTGKTYEALEVLKKAQIWIYPAPLRLLAMEVQEAFLSCGIP